MADSVWEAIGAGDAAQGIQVVQAIAGVEALRALPPETQLKAVSAMTEAADGYDAANAAYARWAQQNPNAAAVAGAVGNVAEQVASRGKKGSVSAVVLSDMEKAQQRAEKLSRNDRSGKDFTKAGKEAVIELNRSRNHGKVICESCGIETVPAQKSMTGVTPSQNERHVDHVHAKSKGGSGTPDNGQVLCRTCNLQKSNK